MSSMAKIFVVVNLVFGIVAFASAATLLGAQDDYKSELAKLSEQHREWKAAADKQIADAELRERQQAQKASEEHGLRNQAEAENGSLKTQLADARTANQTLTSTVDTFTQDLRRLGEVNEAHRQMLERLASETQSATQQMLNAKSELEKEIGNRVGLEQQVTELTEQTQTLAAEKGDLERRLREAEFYLQQYRTKFGDIVGGKGSQGVVNAVRENLVSISVGSADGVRVGDVYHIRRGDTYVGQIRITTVDKNLAVGVFDTEFTGAGAPPQKGDVAYPQQ